MSFRTGPGPYRIVSDNELRDIFFLVPQTGRSFAFSITTTPPPGTNGPVVTELLRAMLYLLLDTPAQRAALMHAIETRLPDRNDIAIRAKLLSLCRQALSETWAFPALVDTMHCRRFHAELKPIASTSDTVANLGADPVTQLGVGAALVRIASSAVAFGWGLTNYFAGKSKDYYEFYVRRIESELALRGIPPSSL